MLILADILDPLAPGPTGEGIGPAAARQAAKKCLKKSGKNAAEETIRIRHYTNTKGLKGIEESGVIRSTRLPQSCRVRWKSTFPHWKDGTWST